MGKQRVANTVAPATNDVAGASPPMPQSAGVHMVLLQFLVAMCSGILFSFWSAVIFATWAPPARCIVPGADLHGDNLSYSHLLGNMSQYYAPVAQGAQEHCYYCPIGSGNGTEQCTSDKAMACDHGIVFDVSDSPTVDTLQMQFGMACSGRYKHDILITMLPVGQIGGSLLAFLADKYGRRPVMIGTTVGLIVVELFVCLWSNYYIYAICIVATTAMAFLWTIAVYTYGVESMSESGRAIVAALEGWGVAIGALIVGVPAVLGVHHWRLIHLAPTVPVVLSAAVIAYLWPESINWLLTRGDLQSAVREARRMSHISGNTIDDGDDADEENTTKHRHNNLPGVLQRKMEEIERIKWENRASAGDASLLSLFRSPACAVVTLVVFFNWITVGMLQYGLLEDTGALPGNPSANYVYSALAMLPGTLTVYPVIRLAGRRGGLLLYWAVTGTSCIVAAWLDRPQYAHLEWLVTAMTMVARSCSIGAFSTVYVYTAELFPTVLRGTTFGACGLFARLGAIAAPQIEVLATPLVGEWLTYAAVGAVALLAAIGSVLLPETGGRVPANTVAEFRRLCAWKERNIVQHNEAQGNGAERY